MAKRLSALVKRVHAYFDVRAGLCLSPAERDRQISHLIALAANSPELLTVQSHLSSELTILDDKANALLQASSLGLAAVVAWLQFGGPSGLVRGALFGCVALFGYSALRLLRLNVVFWSTTDDYASETATRATLSALLQFRDERTLIVRQAWRRSWIAVVLLGLSIGLDPERGLPDLLRQSWHWATG